MTLLRGDQLRGLTNETLGSGKRVTGLYQKSLAKSPKCEAAAHGVNLYFIKHLFDYSWVNDYEVGGEDQNANLIEIFFVVSFSFGFWTVQA